jgi:NitT/TauT family transport system substrate-binding protein
MRTLQPSYRSGDGPGLTRRTLLRGLALGSVGSLLAGCAPAASPAAQPPAAAAAAPTTAPAVPAGTLRDVQIGAFTASVLTAWNSMALRKDLYKDEGLHGVVTEANSADLLRELAAKRLDISTISVGTGVSGVVEGAAIVSVGTLNNSGDLIYVSNDIKQWSDLAGKKFITGVPGTTPFVTTQALFKKHNLPDGSVNVQSTNLVDKDKVAALLSGQTDATIAGSELQSTVEQTGKYSVLASVAQELPGVPNTTLWVRTDLLAQDQNLVVATLRAYLRGVRYAYDHPDETIQYLKEVLKSDDDALMKATEAQYRKLVLVDPNLTFSPEVAQNMLDFTPSAVGKITIDKFANFDVRQKVLDSIGQYTVK